jgi:hypothetical protein
MEFNSARAFAEHIKTELYEFGAEPEDLEVRQAALRKRYADEITASGFDVVKEYTALNTAYTGAVDALVSEFYASLPRKVRANFLARFHFSTIDNRVLNASIMRSKDGRFYGVFIYSALITVLHRLGKLELACHFPDQVDFCSRFPGEKVTRRQMIEIYAEVYVYFTTTKLPHGPQVLLKEPLNSQHLLKLKVQELLIIFHELAHFLNEDLKAHAENRKLSSLFPNQSYQREHLADIVGFGLLLRQFGSVAPVTRDLRYLFLMCLIDLFKVQHEIQGIETELYPHPLNRMSVVIGKFYGAATEEWVADAILNDNTKNLSLGNFPDIESDEQIILNYIELQLIKAFED